MSFRRLTRGHVLALLGALLLLFAMAPDWYTDKVGEQDRFIQHQIVPQLDRETTPTQSQLQLYAEFAKRLDAQLTAWKAMMATDLPALNKKIVASGVALIDPAAPGPAPSVAGGGRAAPREIDRDRF